MARPSLPVVIVRVVAWSLSSRALATSPSSLARAFHPESVVRSTFSLVMVNSTPATGLHSAVGSSLPVPSLTPLVSVCSHLWMVSEVSALPSTVEVLASAGRAGRGDERARGERHRGGEAEAPAHGEGVHGCSLLWLWDDIGI